MTEPGELVGEFWDPAHSGYRIRGVLTLDSSEHPRVSLERSLTSPYTPYGSSGQSFALISAVDEVRLDRVVGELADGRFIILESAQTVARELSSGQQTIEALSAISGPCPPILPMVFDHFRVTFTSVQGWNSLDFGPPQSLAGGGLVQWTRTPNGTQLMTAEVIDCPPCSHREADKRYSVPIASLLTIASRTGVKAIRLEAAQSKSDVWFSIHYKGLGTPAVPAVSAPPLIDAATLTAERLAEWIMAAERLGPLHALLAHDASASVFQIETRCLVLTTALEGLQSRYAESVEPSAKTLIGRVRTAAVEAAKTVDSAVGERVDGLLQQLESLSYKAKLDQLSKRVIPIAPEVMGKRSRWMREVSAVRRSFAHPYGLHYDVLTNLDTYVAICYSLQWFMSVFMLSEAGIDHETIRTALANSNQYQIFLQNARKWLPYVYER